MSAAHTSGPWTVSRGSPHLICSEDYWVASTMGVKGPEAEANARLIAAAPELLEALERLVSVADHAAYDANTGAMDDAINAARAAITSAREGNSK